MQVDKVSFQAQLPYRLRNKLFMEAYTRGSASSEAFIKQAKNLEKWGMDTSTLIQFKPDGKKESVLGLVNNYLAPFRRVEFPKKRETVFDTFMSLTELDIQNAENSLKI